MTVHHQESDVLVIGGGPAGSTMASFLRKKGHTVTVLERNRFPREHVGESMLPFCYRVFEDLGVLDEMKERFVRKPGVRFIDVDGTTNTAWCFNRHITDESNLSFQVIRSEFDDLLLRHSQSLGADVRQETRVVDVTLAGEDGDDGTNGNGNGDGDGDDRSIVTAQRADGTTETHSVRFVVDASGRDTFLSNRMGTKTAHKELERTALSSTNWKGAKFEDTLEQGLIQIVYLGGEKQGWIWCIPLGTDRVSVGVVMNTAYYRAQRARLREAGVEDWRPALYHEELQAAPYTRDILADAEMVGGLNVNGDYSYVCHQKWGDNFALVGDASAFIDPIFSTGVYMAMKSSQIVSNAVDQRLREGVESTEGVFKESYESVTGAYDLIDKLIRLFYTPEAINFAQLATADKAFADFDHYRNAMGVYHFLISGDYFERPDYYDEVIETLRDGKMFHRYRKTIIDRPTLNTTSCDVPTDVAFHEGLRKHEPRRQREGI
jgi:flavin-dependent dehydrogenase